MHIAPRFAADESAAQFIEIANAYLDAAIELSERMASGAWAGSYYRGQAALWLAFHATESFLKGCIKTAAVHVGNLHSITELQLKFQSTFPSIQFEPLFTGQEVPPDPEIMEAALKADKELHQELRYPVSSTGTCYGEHIRGFQPTLFALELRRASVEFQRVHAEVLKCTGG